MAELRDTPDLDALREQIALEVRAELRREWERSHAQKQQALLALTRSAQVTDTAEAFRRLTEASAETLGVARVGVWLYDETAARMRAEDLCERLSSAAGPSITHAANAEILRDDYPAYFAALEENRTLVADDARAHPATRELAATYLEPLGITSLLDAPIRADGRVIGVVCHAHVGAPRAWNPEEVSFAGSLADLAAFIVEQRDLRRAEAALRESERRYAFLDTLTGLPNRALFLDRAGRLLERGRRHPEGRCAVLAVDADRFKIINESLGPHIGDRMLVALSRVLLGCVGPDATVARLGGDDFAILLEDVRDEREAIAAAERTFAALVEPLREDGHEVFASVSVGIALSSPEHARPEDLLRDAEIALNRAKNRGRDRFEIYDAAWAASARSSLHLYTELRHAINRRNLVLHYQPIVSLDTGKITGV